MRRNNKMLIIAIIFFVLIMLLIPTYSYGTNPGSPIANPGDYKPGDITDADTSAVMGKANKILSVISTVGIVVSAITLMVLGIKYMVGSVSEKAEYKKSMIPYVIGVILILSTSAIVGIIAQMTQNTFETKEKTITDLVPVIQPNDK